MKKAAKMTKKAIAKIEATKNLENGFTRFENSPAWRFQNRDKPNSNRIVGRECVNPPTTIILESNYSRYFLKVDAPKAPAKAEWDIKVLFKEAEGWVKPEGFKFNEDRYYRIADLIDALCVDRFGVKIRKVRKKFRKLVYMLMSMEADDKIDELDIVEMSVVDAGLI